jgi:hypothetical protein
MSPIDKALAAIELRELGEGVSHKKYAAKYGVSPSTLSRRVRGITSSKKDGMGKQQALHLTQELELCCYISELTVKDLLPTRKIPKNFASAAAGRRLHNSWLQRFLHRNQDHLISCWSTDLDCQRSQADTPDRYKEFFNIQHKKMRKHCIQQHFTYNMNEKGFMLGVKGKTKRQFSKEEWVKGGKHAAIRDGSRQWVTELASICTDEEKHQVFVASSDSGWTNDNLGLAWLRDVFDRSTKEKCRRSWRLLILDGHGSHVPMEFINYCDENRILLAFFPPHSTHSLQPLEVVMFSPLQRAYQKEQGEWQQKSSGLLNLTKGNFFSVVLVCLFLLLVRG